VKTDQRRTFWRRAVVFGVSAILACLGLSGSFPSWWVAFICAALLFSALFNSLLYAVGFVGSGHEPAACARSLGLDRFHDGPKAPPRCRAALVMPSYHEQTERVYGRIRATWRSVLDAGMDRHCDFYFLSDSTSPVMGAARSGWGYVPAFRVYRYHGGTQHFRGHSNATEPEPTESRNDEDLQLGRKLLCRLGNARERSSCVHRYLAILLRSCKTRVGYSYRYPQLIQPASSSALFALQPLFF
jgi:hypothetical protein